MNTGEKKKTNKQENRAEDEIEKFSQNWVENGSKK